MRILITGGAGFIGSHVAEACLAQGHEVCVVDDLTTGSRAHVPPGARFYEVDLRSPQIDEVLAAERPEVVSHHAAQVSVRHSMEEPVHDASVNVLGSLHLLEAPAVTACGTWCSAPCARTSPARRSCPPRPTVRRGRAR